MKKIDRTNTTCPLCDKGTLLERSLNDDWDGLLTCGGCHQRVDRYETTQADNVVNLFPEKYGEALTDVITEQPLREHFQHFLNTLDSSLDSFQELSVMDKYNLYSKLVSFTHTSLESYLRLKGE